jgi:hypothetical protein
VKTIKMQGGLGNQLFCLAFARSAARLSGGPVVLDLAPFAADRHGRRFDLAALARRLGLSQFTRRPLLSARPTTAVFRLLPIPGYVSEGAPPADEAGLAALVARGGYFNGYWQDERYIADPRGMAAATRAFVLERAPPVPTAGVVLHYRTYKEERRARNRLTPDAAYVRAALAEIEARGAPTTDIRLVSDDPALALQRLGDLGRPITVAADAGPWADLALMMKARALILSNSSFSWWGGFCGDAETVIYPRPGGYVHYPAPAARFICA